MQRQRDRYASYIHCKCKHAHTLLCIHAHAHTYIHTLACMHAHTPLTHICLHCFPNRRLWRLVLFLFSVFWVLCLSGSGVVRRNHPEKKNPSPTQRFLSPCFCCFVAFGLCIMCEVNPEPTMYYTSCSYSWDG